MCRIKINQKYGQRIKDAILAVREQYATQVQTSLDRYLQLVSPSLADKGDSVMPASLASVKGRCATRQTGAILCYMVTEIILEYYKAINGHNPERLESHVMQFEELAKSDPDTRKIEGSETEGWKISYVL